MAGADGVVKGLTHGCGTVPQGSYFSQSGEGHLRRGSRGCCWKAGAEPVGRGRSQRPSWEAGKAAVLLRSSEDACGPGCRR